MLKQLKVLLISSAITLISLHTAWGITIDFSGTISDIGSNTTGELDNLNVGNFIQGSFVYNQHDTNDINSWSVIGKYPFNTSNSDINVNIYDNFSKTTTKVSETGHIDYIQISNNWSYPNYPTLDSFTLVGNFVLGIETMEIFLRFQNINSNLNQITSDNLLNVPLDYSVYTLTNGTITNKYRSLSNANFDIFYASFTDDSQSPIPTPEPSTIVLLLVGLTYLFIVNYKKKCLTK